MKLGSFLVLMIGLAWGFSGCQNPCDEVDCLNGSTCMEGTCNCLNGFSGINCETEDLCVSQNVDCQNDGSCENGVCDCPDGYIGANCEFFDVVWTQFLLNSGQTPLALYKGGIPLNSLFGKIYQEGLIFYLDTINGNGLVAATADQAMEMHWGCNGKDIAGLMNVKTDPFPTRPEIAEGARIGDGKNNTNAILSACAEIGAAKLCRDFGNDWFLPSRGELNLMYNNLHANGHGYFALDGYWSSTEYDGLYAWNQVFDDGIQRITNKKDGRFRNVRAAKAF